MDRATVDIYEERGLEWAAHHPPVQRAEARAFARKVPTGAVRVDLGCGAGRYTGDLGTPVVGVDAARAMLERCRRDLPGTVLVQGDLEALPFGTSTLHGGWAHMSYLHVPSTRLPGALADLHRVLVVGAPLDLQVLAGDYEGDALPADRIGGRFFASWTAQGLSDVLVGAGFEVGAVEIDRDFVRASARRARTLPDFVGPGMRLLVVGLNPSLYAADAGVGFARPGNRFWPAARRAGLVTRDRDPLHALGTHGVGMTDLVKRATSNSVRAHAGRVPHRHGPGRAIGALARARRGVLRGPDGVATRRRRTRTRRDPATAHRRSSRVRHALHERSQRARARRRAHRPSSCRLFAGRRLNHHRPRGAVCHRR